MNFLCTNNISYKNVIVHNLSANFKTHEAFYNVRNFSLVKGSIAKFSLLAEPLLLNFQCFAKRKTLL